MKKIITASVDEHTVKRFNKILDEKLINKSKLIEKLILEWLNKNETTS